MGHLGVVLYEYLGEEYPEVLGSILGALKVSSAIPLMASACAQSSLCAWARKFWGLCHDAHNPQSSQLLPSQVRPPPPHSDGKLTF